MEFKWNKKNVLKILKLNNAPSENSASQELIKAKKNIFMQAGLAVLTIVLTIAIIFSMTAAWYTNIVQTSGLVFKVESWGYEGNIVIDNGPEYIAPGDSGVVGLSVDGGSEEILDVKVNVSKKLFADENMKERLFFYVETSAVKNDEQMERVYINEYEDYSYTLFGGSIVMNEDFSNVPALKWQWVYDVLGYYVLADEITDENEDITNLSVKEYLRPIEYDYDKATFTQGSMAVEADDGTTTDIATKEIMTVDGKRTPEQFLRDFSAADGYPGEIITGSAIEKGETQTEIVEIKGKKYYYVGEDENGGGSIYAYLCSCQEIENSTDEDTAYGKAALDALNNDDEDSWPKFEATVSVSVEQKQFETVEITDLSDLQNEIENPENNGKILKLSTGIKLTDKALVIPADTDVLIDLGGNTVTTAVSGNRGAIQAQEGSSVTMINGTVEYESGTKRGIEAVGAELNLNNVDVKGFEYGVYIGDNLDGSTNDSVVRMTGCEADASFVTVFISGNGVISEGKTTLIIDDCTLTSAGYAVSGNGTVAENGGRWGTDIQIINSTLTSRGTTEDGETWGTAIYHPQKDSTLTVYNSNLSGPLGMVIKGGFAEIIDSKVTANGDFYELKISNSGFSNTGDAIYIETNYGYGIGLVIRETGAVDENGSTVRTVITATNDQTESLDRTESLRVFPEDAANVSIEIMGGVFTPVLTDESWISENSEATGSSGSTVVTAKTAE